MSSTGISGSASWIRRKSRMPSSPEVFSAPKFMSWMNDADVPVLEPLDRLLGGGRGEAGDVVEIEQHAQGVSHRRLVVDDQDLEAPVGHWLILTGLSIPPGRRDAHTVRVARTGGTVVPRRAGTRAAIRPASQSTSMPVATWVQPMRLTSAECARAKLRP